MAQNALTKRLEALEKQVAELTARVSALGIQPDWRKANLDGYRVEALDGEIGSINEQVNAPNGESYVVVDTGPWIFGHKVLLPAGLIDRVHPEEEKVYVERTKDAGKEWLAGA